ncbi:unnamed protein product [Ascophyllum nodosum]
MQVNLQPVVSDSNRGNRAAKVPRPRTRSFAPRVPKAQPRRPGPPSLSGGGASRDQDGTMAARGAQGSSPAPISAASSTSSTSKPATATAVTTPGTAPVPSPLPRHTAYTPSSSPQAGAGPPRVSSLASLTPTPITSMPPPGRASRAAPRGSAAGTHAVERGAHGSRIGMNGGALKGSLLRPGSSLGSIAAPGSSLTSLKQPGSSSPKAFGSKGSEAGGSGAGNDPGGTASGGKRKSSSGKPNGKEKLKELTAEDVATMKIAEFCTSYKSRLPSKLRGSRGLSKAKREAGKDAEGSRKKKHASSGEKGDGAEAAPRPKSMKVTLVDGKLVLRDEDLILEGPNSLDDDNREEVDEDNTTTATARSFTNRETTKRWLPRDTIKFYRALQRYNTSFGMMAKMFEGERTVKQLKKKYMKEMKENPKCVNRALSVPIDQDHPFFSENPPPLPNFKAAAKAASAKIGRPKSAKNMSVSKSKATSADGGETPEVEVEGEGVASASVGKRTPASAGKKKKGNGRRRRHQKSGDGASTVVGDDAVGSCRGEDGRGGDESQDTRQSGKNS